MAKQFSGYQKDIIRNYYNNIDKIATAKLQELVAEIYLAGSEEKKMKLWQKVESAMKQLKIPPKVASHILKQKDPQLLAKNLTEWLK